MTHRNNLNIFPAACLIAISPIFDEYFLMFSKKSFKSLIDASLMDSRSFGICSRICLENLKKINQRFVIIWLACIKFWWCLSTLTRWRSGFFNIGGNKTFLPTHLHGTRSKVFRTDTTRPNFLQHKYIRTSFSASISKLAWELSVA